MINPNAPRLAWLVVIVGSLLGAAGVARAQSPPAGSGAADPRLQPARERYDFAHWPKGEPRTGLALQRLDIAGFQGDEVEASLELPLSRSYFDAQGRKRFLIETWVMDTVAQAQEQLLSCIASVSTTRTLDTAATAGVAAGDIGYVGYSGAGPGRIAWTAFVRGNVCVRLVSIDSHGDLYPDMPAIAGVIDAAVRAAPALAAGSSVPRPQILSFAAARNACVAGEVIALDVKAIDGAGELPLIGWVVGGPGQGYVESGRDGKPSLHTTGPGRIRLTLIVTGSSGLSSSANVVLEVADD